MSRLEDRRNARDGRKGLAPRPSITAAVDLGATKIACFILKPDGVRRSDRTLQPAGVGYIQSRGVRGGSVVNIEDAVEAIAQAVERAETVAGVSVQGVTVATSGGQLASRRVSVEVGLNARPVSDADRNRAIAAAAAQARVQGRRPIHYLPIAWSVDGQGEIRDPRSMFGRVLGLELLVVSISESAYQTLDYCVERAHLQLDGVVAAPFVSALACLEDDEMDLGCICIDMGGGSTAVSVFAGGALVHVDSLAVGGQHVTADVARGLSTSIAGAERIKTLHGSAIASANEDRETIEAPPRGDEVGAGPVVVPRSLLKGIIAPRVEETLELVRERLKASGCPLTPGGNVVLTGGASQLEGVREVAQRVFERPVRLGRPRRAPHLADAAAGPAFCTAAGVLHRAAFGPAEATPSNRQTNKGGRKGGPAESDGNGIANLLRWLRENL